MAVTDPALRMRLRMVVHAGEVHSDNRGFYGAAIDVAIRLLDSAPVKTALRQAASPLVLVVSEEIYFGIVAHGYVDGEKYRPLARVRVANKRHDGWVYIPDSANQYGSGSMAQSKRPPPKAIVTSGCSSPINAPSAARTSCRFPVAPSTPSSYSVSSRLARQRRVSG